MEEAPFGWPHRQKRSLARMQGNDRSASPAWSFTNIHPPHEQPRHPGRLSVYHSPQPHSLDYPHDQIQHHHHHPESHFESFYNVPDAQAGRPMPYPDTAGATPTLEYAQRLPQAAEMAAQPPRRFAGDGYDYRRPAGPRNPHVNQEVEEQEEEEEEAEDDDDDAEIMLDFSGPPNDSVIDLTADDSGYGASQDGNNSGMRQYGQNPGPSAPVNRSHTSAPRLPRGMDIIIDLDSGAEEWREAAPSSPEIEFISARSIDPHQRRPWLHPGNRDADEVQFVREQALPEDEVRRRSNGNLDHALNLLGIMNGEFNHLRAQVDRFNDQLVEDAAGRPGRGPIAPPRIGSSRRGPRPGHVRAFVAPALDFGMIGFDMMGMGGARAAEPQIPQTYEAPPKAPDGFTRSPAEEDVLVCPNCGDELCVGGDDAKKQVWIVKGCGHVYCGECTANRTVKKTPKGKEKPPNTKPFKICVVDDCGKSVVNRKSMIQVFL